MAPQTSAHLEAIRADEIERVLELLPKTGRLLEIGAGTGWQAQALAKRGYSVLAIDIPTSNYKENRVWPIQEYDGKRIPFDDEHFDIVVSSNVLEHIPHVVEFQREIYRVLKSDGVVAHVLPSSAWRFWTAITHLLKRWTIPDAHGEHAGNAVAELFYFSRRWWRRKFDQTGWRVVICSSNQLFYTGHSILDARLSISSRRLFSKVLGGSCNIFLLTKSMREKER